MRKSIFAIVAWLAILSAGSLVPTRADATTLGGPFGIRLAVDAIDPIDMARCAAAVAVMTYVIADLPQRLGE